MHQIEEAVVQVRNDDEVLKCSCESTEEKKGLNFLIFIFKRI